MLKPGKQAIICFSAIFTTRNRRGALGASRTRTFNEYKNIKAKGKNKGTDTVSNFLPDLEWKVTRVGLRVPVVDTNIRPEYHVVRVRICYICTLVFTSSSTYPVELTLIDKKIVEVHNDPLSANLSVLNLSDVPFQVHRIYWISNFKKGTIRGRHAHKSLTQMMLLLSGTLELSLYDGPACQTFFMQAGDDPILIKPGRWRIMQNGSPDAVVLVLASHEYDESDYIRDWNSYLEWHNSLK